MKKRTQLIPAGKKSYTASEALGTLKNICTEAPRKFDETVEVALKLGIDPKKPEQQLRGTFVLPHGTGRVPRILVFALGDKATEAQEAGADFVGGEDLADKIVNEGWLDFDIVISTPDMMRVVGKLGKILGPRGMMPNPKSGTVTFSVKETVGEFKRGKVEYRNDKFGNIHVPIGRVSFEQQQLEENFQALYLTILRAKPSAAKGQYVKNVAVAATMSPGLKIDLATLSK